MSTFEFTEKLLGKNMRFFDETIMKFYRLAVFYEFPICDDNFFLENESICVIFFATFLLAYIKENMLINANKKLQKVATEYRCMTCDYSTTRKSSYEKHLLTRKHLHANSMLTNANTPYIDDESLHICCICNMVYNHASSLARHKKSCKKLQKVANKIDTVYPNNDDMFNEPNDTVTELKGMIYTLVTQNKDMQGLITSQNNTIVEMVKTNQMTTTNNNNSVHNNNNYSNSHNKTFNLNFFLNETCKDAMNITDFVDSLKLSLRDLERMGELGYAEGISQAFVNGLNDLDITKRPIHCSDSKREILHIKDHDKWEKDTPNQDRLKDAIKKLSNKNIMVLDDWRRENPGCTEYNHNKNNMYLRMQSEAMGPNTHETERRDFGKIIRKIARHTIINKQVLNDSEQLTAY